MSDPLRVEIERSGVVESVHLVDVAVVDRSGRLVARAGDPEQPAAFRSSAKPIQARVACEAGWMPRDKAALAIACASHNAEPAHVEQVRALLATAGLDEDALRCPPDAPLARDAALAVGHVAPVLHNCSGKHAAMLAACVVAGWPTEDYRAPDHPLQAAIRERMTSLLGPDVPMLTDGCGVPTFVAPLARLATAFSSADGTPEADAMRTYPFMVGGTDRVDTDLMTAAPGLLAKGGAEALLCVVAGEHAIALKVRDGGSRAVGPAALHVLAVLGHIDRTASPQHAEPPVLGGGRPVGHLRARGELLPI